MWRPLITEIENRWASRFRADTTKAVRTALCAVIAGLDLDLPEYMPVLRYGLFSQLPNASAKPLPPAYNGSISGDQLPTLLSKVLLAIVLEFEKESHLSLAISANVLRLYTVPDNRNKSILMRDLPALSGVSKEAISMATGYLIRNGYAVVQPDPASKGAKSVSLTSSGVAALEKYDELMNSIETRWMERFGRVQINELNNSLSALYRNSDSGKPLLSEGLQPYPDGWRARKPYVTQTNAVIRDPAAALPHFPMVLHRGGYPDGS